MAVKQQKTGIFNLKSGFWLTIFNPPKTLKIKKPPFQAALKKNFDFYFAFSKCSEAFSQFTTFQKAFR